MIVLLRFIGIVNAAVWLGTSIFLSLGIAPALFSTEMEGALRTSNFHYFAGQIAHVFFGRYFLFHIVCAVIAIFHLIAEKLYLGRPASGFTVGLLVVLLNLTLFSGIWLQPKMHGLHVRRYAQNVAPTDRAAAAHSFGAWHGLSQVLNLFIICGIVIYVWRVNNPPDTTTFVRPGKFGG